MNVQYRVSNVRNDYYAVGEPDRASLLTVVHTGFDTFVCLTCHRHDCEHAMATEQFVTENGPPPAARNTRADRIPEDETGQPHRT
jgi:hypothetical protein